MFIPTTLTLHIDFPALSHLISYLKDQREAQRTLDDAAASLQLTTQSLKTALESTQKEK